MLSLPMNVSAVSGDPLGGTLTSTNSTSPPEKEDLSPLGYSVAAVFLFFIMVFGIINNLCVIVAVTTTRKLRTPMNFILLNLSVSDFTISLVGTPMSFASAVSRQWVFGPFLCEMYAFLMTLTVYIRQLTDKGVTFTAAPFPLISAVYQVQKMPLTSAERQRNYRERVKQNAEKYKQVLIKDKEKKLKRKKISELTESEKISKRKYWCKKQAERRLRKTQEEEKHEEKNNSSDYCN